MFVGLRGKFFCGRQRQGALSLQVVCEAVKVNRKNRHGLGVKIGISGTGGGEFAVPDAAELRAANNLLDQHGKLPVTGLQSCLHLVQQ